MKTKPFYFDVITLFLLVVAVSLPIQILFLFDYQLQDWTETFQHLTFLNWLFMGSSLISAYFLYCGHRYALAFSTINICTVFSNNLIVGVFGSDFSINQSLWGAVLYSIPLLPIYFNPLRETLLNSKQQWWRTAPRYSKQLDVQIWSLNGKPTVNAKTINISKTGALLEVPSGAPLHYRIPMALYVNEITPVHCEAKIVRHISDANNNFDKVGIEFLPLTKEQTQVLESCLKLVPLPIN